MLLKELARIEQARQNQATELDLSSLGLSVLPESIGQLTQLRELGLSKNRLTALPESVGQLTQLRHLDFSLNQFAALPEAIGQLTQLQELILSDNALTTLPESIGQLTRLRELNLLDNQLTALPESIGGLIELEELNLFRNQLASLPESFSRLAGLQLLNLSRNQLKALPELIGQLSQLRELNLLENQLKALPGSIGQLARLRWLDLSRNQLKALPESIGQLTQLQRLNLTGNQLRTLPESIGQLMQLQRLYVTANQLTTLPESIGQLTQLQQLYITGNQLETLPESIGQLTQFRSLNLANNKLAVLPKSIEQMTRLQRLDLSNNRLTTLPDFIGQLIGLERLILSSNQLTTLPESLQNLESLKELYLHENETLGLPDEVLGPALDYVIQKKDQPAKPGEILEYYFRVRGGRRPLNEAKLILVGRGAVGKTSLVNRLVKDQFNSIEKKTDGINITEWKLRLNGNEEVRLNVWDFGGQEIMHATHQFFLTWRSLYLLVLNGREGAEDTDAEYWLKLIESFGADSPVIVVLNKIKVHPFSLNSRALQQKYPFIRDFVKTDCADGIGIPELRQVIERETHRLEHLRDAFPAAWFSIKDQLAGMKKNYLSFEEYCNVCNGLGETDKTAQEALAGYLHNLGIVLNYKDDPRLQDTHVLNPHWVTNGIYKIINSEKLEKQQGEIWLNDLDAILDAGEYPLSMRRFIFDLLKKFELCFSFPDDDPHYLIPELLDKQEPVETAAFKPEACLNFQYHYSVLPEGLLPRFIVRTHVLSEGLSRWRTGAILALEGCRGLVKADLQDKKVFISISGPALARRRLLAVIRSDFERIHRDIRNLQPQEMVPLPDYPNVVVPYEKLLAMERQKIGKFPEFAAGQVIELDVQELLNGVDLEGTRKKEGTMEAKREAVRLFYSYSRKDETLRNELETHLKLLQRQDLIDAWHDRNVEAGDEWKQKIDENLERAEIILLLVSADFIASDYCYEKEMQRALERHEKGKARVIPVIVRDVNWKNAPFAKLQGLPRDGKAVTLWQDKDSAWRNVSEGIEWVVEEIRKNARRV
jgi:internalin A